MVSVISLKRPSEKRIGDNGPRYLNRPDSPVSSFVRAPIDSDQNSQQAEWHLSRGADSDTQAATIQVAGVSSADGKLDSVEEKVEDSQDDNMSDGTHQGVPNLESYQICDHSVSTIMSSCSSSKGHISR